MIERIHIKRTEAEIFDDIKVLEEIETKLRELEIKKNEKRFCNEIDEKGNTEKTNNENRERKK